MGSLSASLERARVQCAVDFSYIFTRLNMPFIIYLSTPYTKSSRHLPTSLQMHGSPRMTISRWNGVPRAGVGRMTMSLCYRSKLSEVILEVYNQRVRTVSNVEGRHHRACTAPKAICTSFRNGSTSGEREGVILAVVRREASQQGPSR